MNNVVSGRFLSHRTDFRLTNLICLLWPDGDTPSYINYNVDLFLLRYEWRVAAHNQWIWNISLSPDPQLLHCTYLFTLSAKPTWFSRELRLRQVFVMAWNPTIFVVFKRGLVSWKNKSQGENYVRRWVCEKFLVDFFFISWV